MFLLLARPVLLHIFLVTGSAWKASGLRISNLKNAARADVDDRLVKFGLRETAPKLCFSLAGIDFTTVVNSYKEGVKGNPEFLPSPNTSMAQADDTSERFALREGWTNQSKQCKGMGKKQKSKKRCKFGWGGQIHKWLREFTRAYQTNEAMAEPSDAHGLPWTHYGLMPTSTCKKGKHPSSQAVSDGEVPNKTALWWHAQKMAWLLRPNVTIAKHLKRIKDLLNWEARRPILGLHVRLGDVCTRDRGNRKCDGLDTYMEKVGNMAQLYGFRSIFLATDSAEVVKNTSQYPNFTWLHSPTSGIAQQRDPEIFFDDLWMLPRVSRDFNDLLSADISRVSGESPKANLLGKDIPFSQEKAKSSAGVNKLSSYDFDADAHDYLLDTFLLADADGFVGKFSSNFDQIAYAVGLGQSGCATPYASLDAIYEIREQ